MKRLNARLVCTTLALLIMSGTLLGQGVHNSATADWQKILHQRLLVYGHRNWIIVSDSAFPAYSQSGIETIVANEDLPSVLNYVLKAISSSKHVRATAFVDRELQFVEEDDYPGIMHLRQQITGAFAKGNLSSIPHAKVLSTIDDAGKTFRILFIKTNTKIPYTSVYMRLDCGYMADEVESKIRNAVSARP